MLCEADTGDDTETEQEVQSRFKIRQVMEERAKKQAYWAQRTQELEDRKKEAEDRKKKFSSAGMKYTAIAMSHRATSGDSTS
jgi:conjugal transfer/entry exclusion protein